MFEKGVRVHVLTSPDSQHHSQDIHWGTGEIVAAYGDRYHVHFDDGNGGFFSPSEIYRELGSAVPTRVSWREVAAHLRVNGWSVEYRGLPGFPDFAWRSPGGCSGSEYRSKDPDCPPYVVVRDAYKAGLIGFTEIGV